LHEKVLLHILDAIPGEQGMRSQGYSLTLRIYSIGRGLVVAGAFVGAAAAAITAAPRDAAALPSFARQTGQPCGTCHTDFPGLTPYGRAFKLGGYTAGGGRFWSTPFKSRTSDGPYASANPDDKSDAPKDKWFPPISMMAIVGFTHTQAPLPEPTAPFAPNDNVKVDPASFFYGGAITEHIGAFAQATYVGAAPGGNGPFDHVWTWDNTDIRYADSTVIGSIGLTYGVTVNNNPTVQDVWNTTPAWGFPYAASTIAPTPSASTIIDGTFAAHVLSVGGYLWIDNKIYLEATAYQTLDFHTQNSLGVNPGGAPGLFDSPAPYFRAAFEPNWGNHWLMVGAFGMLANVRPWVDSIFATTIDTFTQTDKYTDLGVDAQYQYKGVNYWFTLRGSYIHEDQRLDASSLNFGTNPTNTLNTARAQASFAYGNDNRIVLTGQYFSTWGSSDTTLYSSLISCQPPNTACSPNSDGWIAELAYIPYVSSKAPLWPWFNVRLGLQYTKYNRFDGDTAHAGDNNTLFAYAWFAM
jgi:hypothetical protein